MVSNDLLVSTRSLHPSQCVLLKPAIGEIISSIKLTESMVLAVDEILHLYTGLCGAMQWSCLLNTGAIFTWRQFLHLAKRRRVHHCAQVPVIFKEWWSHWDYIEWGCERAVVPQHQGCCGVLIKHRIPCSTSVFCTASYGCACVFLGFHVLLFRFLSIGRRPPSQSGGLTKSVHSWEIKPDVCGLPLPAPNMRLLIKTSIWAPL